MWSCQAVNSASLAVCLSHLLTPVGLELAGSGYIVPTIESRACGAGEVDDRELRLALFPDGAIPMLLRSHFADIPGVHLTLQNNKAALLDGKPRPEESRLQCKV